MSQRGVRVTDFEERDYYPPPRRPDVRYDEPGFQPRRVITRSPPPRPRERETAPSFLREDARRTEAGPMVLRQRDVETWDRHPVREERVLRRPRSESPPQSHDHELEHSRTRVVERERERIRSPSVVRRRSPSPNVRFVERRPRSPSPVVREHIHTRITEREREPSSSPSPPPPPSTIKGPTIEREVITHYTDIDHGTIRARAPSPPPPPRAPSRTRERETDIDISLSKNKTEVDVDIHRSSSRARSRSRPRPVVTYDYDDDVVIRRDMDRLRVDDRSHRSHRRSHSAVPIASPTDEEAEYITGKIDSRGRMGEAWGGATKDWTIVDVPPGTERLRMDGVGGASTETNWSKYSGVRRTKFIPERDGQLATVPREISPPPVTSRGRDHTSVTVYDREREIDVDIDRRISHQPTSGPPPPPPTRDMWTEITKDLVCREAIEQLGYAYEETKWMFYIMEYLKYDEVLRLTELTERIRRHRRRHRDTDYDRDYMDDWHRRYRRHHHHGRPRHHHHGHNWEWDDERVREREVIYDSHGPARGYR